MGTLGLLSLGTLRQGYASARASQVAHYQTLGTLVEGVIDRAAFVFLALAFTLGALLYYHIFDHSDLIPHGFPSGVWWEPAYRRPWRS
ncbi:MAG: hypothetical protein ACLQC7_02495 [Thermoplasmata archaeon]